MLTKITTLFLGLLTLLAVTHLVALKLFLYWKFSWFDIPVHFLGGIVVALGIFTLHEIHMGRPTRYLHFIPVVLFVLLVAMAWEVYELLIGIPIDNEYVIDTLTDLGMGTVGAMVGYGIGTFLKNNI